MSESWQLRWNGTNSIELVLLEDVDGEKNELTGEVSELVDV